MATLDDARQVVGGDLENSCVILVDAGSIGIPPADVERAFNEFARRDQVRFWNGPNGSIGMCSWSVTTPDRREYTGFHARGGGEYYCPWFLEFLATLNGRTARLDASGLVTSGGERIPMEQLRFGKAKSGRQRRKPIELPDRTPGPTGHPSSTAARARALLQSPTETIDELITRDFEDDEEAHDNRRQKALHKVFTAAFENVRQELIVAFGLPIREGTDGKDAAVRVAGAFLFAVWNIEGHELALAADHEDRELPFRLVLSRKS